VFIYDFVVATIGMGNKSLSHLTTMAFAGWLNYFEVSRRRANRLLSTPPIAPPALPATLLI
jgi:hypothetical protein